MTPPKSSQSNLKPLEEVTVEDNGDGSYAVCYIADTPGLYSLTALVNGAKVRDMPSQVSVHPAPSALKCTAEGPGVEGGFADRNLSFVITARDAEGKQRPVGGDTFEVNVTDQNGISLPCELTDNSDGTYTGSYVPPAAGSYSVEIQLINSDNVPAAIKGSVFTVQVAPGGDPNCSFAEGAGWHYAFDYTPASFTVYVRDEEDQPVAGEILVVNVTDQTTPAERLRLRAEGKLDIPETARRQLVMQRAGADASVPSPDAKEPVLVHVQDRGDGSYVVTYTAVLPGDYQITATIGESSDGHIRDSPRLIKCHWSCPNKPCRPAFESVYAELLSHKSSDTLPDLVQAEISPTKVDAREILRLRSSLAAAQRERDALSQKLSKKESQLTQVQAELAKVKATSPRKTTQGSSKTPSPPTTAGNAAEMQKLRQESLRARADLNAMKRERDSLLKKLDALDGGAN